MKIKLIIIITLLAQVARANTIEPLIQKITSLRSEVEVISREIESSNKEKQAELDQKNQKKLELLSQVDREKLRSLQISEKLKRLESRVGSFAKANPRSEKKVLAWISELEASVIAGVPFQQNRRLAILDSLKLRAQKHHESLEFILSDLWSFIDGEMNLAQTNEYKIEEIELMGQKKKCELARLGLNSVYAVSSEGKTYLAIKELSGKWKWEDVSSGEQKDSIISLVKNLKNKTDSGFYHLPINKNILGAKL